MIMDLGVASTYRRLFLGALPGEQPRFLPSGDVELHKRQLGGRLP